ncbi:uncharacterized protein BX664DRAFT_268831 [Halteromyces radiatus]|uniref:uncharacterized protein n=1 Tax=Halteromyces radiatus TaxID=101107 RepID=UPI00221E9AAA|nr:uncharacterized protein BX664DRAFT_268831 [Halteromyces radiatus]KAI8081388.1 hypothetical protein BX664DRAFT_268831 [Halteromyces radiatus]
MKRLLETGSQYSLKRPTLLKHMRNMVNELYQDGIPVSPSVYEKLLDIYSTKQARQMVMPLILEMEANGVPLTAEFFHKALQAASDNVDTILQARILERMEIHGVKRTAQTYKLLILTMKENLEFERALDTLEEMKQLDIKPTPVIFMTMIDFALLFNEASIAFDLLEQMEKVETITKKHLYLSALRCAVLTDNYEMVKRYWKTLTKDKNLLPDDGLCKHALLVAARFSDPQLAYDVLYTTGDLGYPYTDHHFTCLLESFASTSDMKNTFRVLTAMRQAGITPSKSTLTPVALRLGKDVNAIIQARQMLVELRKENDNKGLVDVAAFNMIIHTFAYNGQFEESLATFDLAQDLGVTPNVDTLDALLDACIHQRSASHGKAFFNSFRKSGIQPTVVSLSKMVTLMCTQENFEDAFVYLEQIKKTGQIPLRGAYYRLIKKLAVSNDPRLQMALDDMEACGYNLSTHLDDYMEDKAQMHEKRARKRGLLPIEKHI